MKTNILWALAILAPSLAVADDGLEKRVTGTTCAICQLAVGVVENLIKDNAAETEIATALSEFCTVLPSPENRNCASFVKEWAPKIISDVAGELTPNLACTAAAQC